MNLFEKRYQRLNAAQKQAVDTIEGPVMVIAGPGTGKTELLSMRVAHILRQTDALASSILCITYTESGAQAMRNRLIELIGPEAYKVAIYTFHGFGSDMMTRHPEYFYNGAQFQPADQLATFEIIHTILKKLPHSNPLSVQMNDQFVHQTNLKNTISDFKRSGYSSDQLQTIFADAMSSIEATEPTIQAFFDRPITKAMIDMLPDLRNDLLKQSKAVSSSISEVPGLHTILINQLDRVIDEAKATNKTTAITAWRNSWLEKNKRNQFIYKDRARLQRLQAANHIYLDYLLAMEKAGLYDYDDMILRVSRALEIYPELKYTLQETYQHLLIDEFQDTNGAQLRIIDYLTDNPVHEGRPNIMIVGDDDQAIYSFQGADISNIVSFSKKFSDITLISLTENYRSTPEILSHAQEVITQNTDRIEAIFKLNKTPHPHQKTRPKSVRYMEMDSSQDEYYCIAHEIAEITKKHPTASVAVLARGHADIRSFLPYLSQQNIQFHYEHTENIFDQPLIHYILDVAQLIQLIAQNNFKKADQLLPAILAHPMWTLSSSCVSEVSLTSYHEKKTWLEAMKDQPDTAPIAEFLFSLATMSHHMPLPQLFDYIIGTKALPLARDSFQSPIKTHFFNHEILTQQTLQYIDCLNALSTLRSHALQYHHKTTVLLNDFLQYVTQMQQANLSLRIHRDAASTAQVSVMTAHAAKGQEFDYVYVIDVTEQVWGEKTSGRTTRLSYPANLPIGLSGDTLDEKRRLFFVALTRAKQQLSVSYPKQDSKQRTVIPASFLQTPMWQPVHHSITTTDELRTIAEVTWQQAIAYNVQSLQNVLQPILGRYKMSPTHVNNFIDVTRGGPQYFLTQNLLHFPEAIHPAAAMGSSIHTALKQAHQHLTKHHSLKPIEDVLYDFENHLKTQQLDEHDLSFQLQKGAEQLEMFLRKRYQSFSISEQPEVDFRPHHVVVEDVRLTGIIDVFVQDKESKTIQLIDYKTGKPAHSWRGSSEYEKIKLHKYRQQLLFYKLLIEAAPQYAGYHVETASIVFIEPDDSGNIQELVIDWDKTEIQQFTLLLRAIWQSIMNVSLPDISKYPANYRGIIAFEKDLLKT